MSPLMYTPFLFLKKKIKVTLDKFSKLFNERKNEF